MGCVPGAAIAIVDGRIATAGPRDHVQPRLRRPARARRQRPHAIPGLVDCHAHAAFGGDRAGEFELRSQGAGYEQIHAAGGGIAASVRDTRAAVADGWLGRPCSRVTWPGWPRPARPPPRSSPATASTATPSWPCSTPPVPATRSRSCLPSSAPTPSAPSGTTPRLPHLRDRRGAARRRPIAPRPPTCSSSAAPSTATRPSGTCAPRLSTGWRCACTPTSSARAAASPLAVELGARSVDHLKAASPVASPRRAGDVAAVMLPACVDHARPAAPARARTCRRRRDRRAGHRLQPRQRVLPLPAAW